LTALLHQPLFEFDTERLRVRPLTVQDENLYCDLYCDERTMRFIGPPWSREQAGRSFRKALEPLCGGPRKQLILAVMEKATGRGLGICSLQHINEHRGEAEVGVMLTSDCHSLGLAKELTSALVTQAFKAFSLDTVLARIASDHLVAERVLVGVGFHRGDDLPAGHGSPGQKVLFAYRGSWPCRAAIN
jgi:RimJ/RimL family protein N-acetyltransferase